MKIVCGWRNNHFIAMLTRDIFLLFIYSTQKLIGFYFLYLFFKKIVIYLYKENDTGNCLTSECIHI